MPSETVHTPVVDVRELPTPARHPRIVAALGALDVGKAFVLVDDHEPRQLREEFERDLAGCFGWEHLRREPLDWRIRITRTASTPLPRVLLNTQEIAVVIGEAAVAGAVWRLDPTERDLDANLIALPPGDKIEGHTGADLDVLIHVVAGTGTLRTEGDDVALTPGAVVYLPRRARRAVLAGADGLRYLSVHTRKMTMPLTPTVLGDAG